MIRRPKSAEFEGGLVDTVNEATATVGEITQDARNAAGQIGRGLLLFFALPLVVVPLVTWYQAELPDVPPLFIFYGSVALVGGGAYYYFCRLPLLKKLEAKRGRLAELDDVAEMRARLLSGQSEN